MRVRLLRGGRAPRPSAAGVSCAAGRGGQAGCWRRAPGSHRSRVGAGDAATGCRCARIAPVRFGSERRLRPVSSNPPVAAPDERIRSKDFAATELVLKELVVGGTSDDLWNTEINPTDQPRIEAEPTDLEGAIRMALDRRTDVSRARRQLDTNEAAAGNLRNSTLPALDLVGRSVTPLARCPGRLDVSGTSTH